MGVTLYTFVFGQLPFYASNVIELFDLIENRDLTFPDHVGSPDLRRLLARMLDKNPSSRINLTDIAKNCWLGGSKVFRRQTAKTNSSRVLSVSEFDISNAVIHCSMESKAQMIRDADTIEDLKKTIKTIYSYDDIINVTSDRDCSSQLVKIANNKHTIAKFYHPTPLDMSTVCIPLSIEIVLEIIAEQDHFTWCVEKTWADWIYAPIRNNDLKQHPALQPYHLLSDETKTKNRHTAIATIKAVLSLGYKIISPHRKTKKPKMLNTSGPLNLKCMVLPAQLVVLSELLAENAHEVWSEDAIKNGWSYDSTWNLQAKTHPSLLPFMYTPELDRLCNTDGAITTLKTLVSLGFEIAHIHQKQDQRRQTIHFKKHKVKKKKLKNQC
jgi:serine/threonine protein kinase